MKVKTTLCEVHSRVLAVGHVVPLTEHHLPSALAVIEMVPYHTEAGEEPCESLLLVKKHPGEKAVNVDHQRQPHVA